MSIFSTLTVGAARAWKWLFADHEERAAMWRERWARAHGRPWPGMVPPVGAESTAARKAEVRRVRWEREHLVPWPGVVPPQPRPPAPMRDLTPHEAMLEIGRDVRERAAQRQACEVAAERRRAHRGQPGWKETLEQLSSEGDAIRAAASFASPPPPEILLEGEPLTRGERDMIRRARRKGVPTLFPGERDPSGPLDGLSLPELKLLALKVEAEILQRRARALGGTRCDVPPLTTVAVPGMVAGDTILAGSVVCGVLLPNGCMVLYPATAREAPSPAESSDGGAR